MRSIGVLGLVGVLGLLGLSGCNKATPTAVTTTTAATTTTTTASLTNLTIDGVRPGVLQQPFYPQITVTSVTCGTGAKGVPYLQINLPRGAAGTPAGTVLTKATEVIVVPGLAILVEPSYPGRVLYEERMASISLSQGVLVLSLVNPSTSARDTGGDGLSVVPGAVQINGSFQCPG